MKTIAIDVRASCGNVVYTIRMHRRAYHVIAFSRSRDERNDPLVQGSYAERWLREQ